MERLKLIIAGMAILAVTLLAGNSDFEQEVLYAMPNGAYEAIKEVYPDSKDGEVVDVYLNKKEYWDSIAQGR